MGRKIPRRISQSRRKRLAVGLLLFMLTRRALERRRRRPLGRRWTKEFNSHQNRQKFSFYYTLMKELMENDHDSFFKFTRMYPAQFTHLVELMRPVLTSKDSNFRHPITVGNDICLTYSVIISKLFIHL